MSTRDMKSGKEALESLLTKEQMLAIGYLTRLGKSHKEALRHLVRSGMRREKEYHPVDHHFWGKFQG